MQILSKPIATMIQEEDVKGIPNFWLTIFKNVEMLAEMVQDYDEPILEKLEDVTVKIHEKPAMGFTINFHFQVGLPVKYIDRTKNNWGGGGGVLTHLRKPGV